MGENLYVCFANYLCLFDLIIEDIKKKIFLPRPGARYLKYNYCALSLIFNSRWAFEIHGVEGERVDFTFKNVPTESDENAIIYVDPKGFTYTINGQVLGVQENLWHYRREREKWRREGKERGEEEEDKNWKFSDILNIYYILYEV